MNKCPTEAHDLKTKARRWLLGMGIVVVCGFIALNALAYRHAYTMMHFAEGNERTHEPETLTVWQKAKVLFAGVRIPRPRTTTLISDLGPEARSLELDSTNGVRLGAWYCPGRSEGPLVILFHGYTGEKSGTLPEAKAFLELGLSVLLVDFRGSGDSTGSTTTIGFDEAHDVAAAVRYACAHLPHSPLLLYGQSMGAAAVLRAVHACGVQPDAIIVESVFDRLLSTVRHRFEAMGVPSFPSAELLVYWGGHQAGFDGFSHNPVEYASDVRCPILFLHGGADSRAHLEEARRVFSAVHGAKRFREFSDLGHQSLVRRHPSEWTSTVKEFLVEGRILAGGADRQELH